MNDSVVLRQLRSSNLSSELARALELHKQIRAGHEASEGMAAFREPRKPNWQKP